MTFSKPFYLTLLGFVCAIVACVTINIYFPAEKVESVAGEIVDEIRGSGKGDKKDSGKGGSGSLLGGTYLAFSPSVAWAEEATSVSNPTIRALKSKMSSRFSRMKPYYQKGMLKEGGNGYVSISSTAGFGLKEQRDLKNLVDAENSDRRILYQEVAKALKIDPSQVDRVARIFAKEWQKSVK